MPDASCASDRKHSTPRYGRLLHPSSWAERDDRDQATENFFQGGSPKTGHPTSPRAFLTTRNTFRADFRGWRLDEFSIFACPPPPPGAPPPPPPWLAPPPPPPP